MRKPDQSPRRAPPARVAERPPGRLDRETILGRAYDLTRATSLADLSIVHIAASLGVRPGTIHYHFGTRDDLVSAVMNRFYRDLDARVAPSLADGAWQQRLHNLARHWLAVKIERPGIASYIAAENRFRVFQKIVPGEIDYGACFMDRVFGMLKDAGLDAAVAAECWHILALTVNATAVTISMNHAPSAHGAFLRQRASTFAAASFPGLTFGLPALAELDAVGAFEHMIDDMIAGVESRQKTSGRVPPDAERPPSAARSHRRAKPQATRPRNGSPAR